MLWKKIEDYPSYSVSDQGDIKNVTSGVTLKPRDNGAGYLIVTLYRNGVPKAYQVHRLVLEAFDPIDSPFCQCHHIDGDRYNNALDNLEWILTSQHKQESTNRNKYLSKETVLSILDDFYTYRISKPDLCEKYNLRPLTIANIVALRSYRRYYMDKLEYYQSMRKDMHSNRMDKMELSYVKWKYLIDKEVIVRKGISKRAIKQACKNATDQLDNIFYGSTKLMEFFGVISPSTGDGDENEN